MLGSAFLHHVISLLPSYIMTHHSFAGAVPSYISLLPLKQKYPVSLSSVTMPSLGVLLTVAELQQPKLLNEQTLPYSQPIVSGSPPSSTTVTEFFLLSSCLRLNVSLACLATCHRSCRLLCCLNLKGNSGAPHISWPLQLLTNLNWNNTKTQTFNQHQQQT